MQNITVGDQSFPSDTLSEVVVPGANATLSETILTLDSMRGGDGEDGNNAAIQNIVVAGQTYNSDSLTYVVSGSNS